MPDAIYKNIGYVGTILVIIVIAGTFLTEDYRSMLHNNENSTFILIDYEQDDRIEFITRGADWDNNDDFLRWKYTEDKFTLYSNSLIGLKEDWVIEYYKTYGIDEWIRLDRKPSQIRLYYHSDENSMTVIKETPYYESQSRSGTGGTLIQNVTITDISTFEQFPENYMITWIPEGRRVTSDMRLIWRVHDFVPNLDNIEGMHDDGSGLSFGLNMKVTWKDAMDQFDYYTLDNVDEELEVNFKPDKGIQEINVRAFDPASTVILYLNGSSIDRDIEYGEPVNITATVDPAGLQVCLSIDHPSFGYNFTCGTTSIEYIWTAEGGIRTFNDSATSNNYTFTGAGINTSYLNQIRNSSELLTTKINIRGYNTSNHYPKGVKIDVGGDGTNNTVTSGELRGTETYLFEFNDSTSSKTFEYNESKNNIAYFKLPKDFNVTNSTLNVTGTGNNYQEFDYLIPSTYHYNYNWASAKRRDGTEIFYSFGGKFMSGTYKDYLNLTWTWDVDGSDISILGKAYQSPTPIGLGASIHAPDNQVSGYYGFFIIGGWDGSSTYYNTTRYYRLGYPGPWTTKTEMPIQANGRIGEIDRTNDIIYLFGGTNSTDVSMKTSHKYNITADSWTQLADMPFTKAGGWAEWYNTTHILVWGGWHTGSSSELNTFTYDTVNDAWTDMGSSAHLSDYHGSGFKLNDEIYATGGTTGSAYRDEIYRYDKSTDYWIEMEYELESYHIYAGDCDEYLGRAYCISSGGNGYGSIIHTIYVLPNSPFLQVGNYINNTWNHADDLVGTEDVGDFSTEINEYLDDCTATDGYCDVPIYLFDLRTGNITIDSINITTDVEVQDLDISSITCTTDYCNETISVWSDQNGTVELSNINFTYKGTSRINITAHTVGNGTHDPATDTQWATIYHSKYERILPYTWTTSLFFLPSSNNSKNVTAFGQTLTTPMVNITGDAQDKGFLMAVQLNSSWSCLNIIVSNTTSKDDGILTNSTYQQICNITTVTGNCSNWGWTDLFSCNATENRYIQPDLKWKSCCDTCMSCF